MKISFNWVHSNTFSIFDNKPNKLYPLTIFDYDHSCTAVTIVGYEQSMYTLFEETGYLEICVVVTRNGSRTPFVININTINGTAGRSTHVQSVIKPTTILFHLQTQQNSYKVSNI